MLATLGGDEVVTESRGIAVAFGPETIVQFAGSYDSVDEAIFTSAQAMTLGIPAMDLESGEFGSIADQYVDPNTDGELNMIVGKLELPLNSLFIADRARVYSEHSGIWYADALVQTGDCVSEGARLGMITDYHGNELDILFSTPPVNERDNIVVIGRVSADTSN